jgi:prepilin-type N-terminal cleavage/methylation domain-containing protein
MNKCSTRAAKGQLAFTLVELMVTIAIIGLVLGIAIPNFLKSRIQARKQACIENLTQIESAKQIWSVQNGKKEGDAVTEGDIIGPLSYIRIMPACPGGGRYDLTTVGENAKCDQPGHSL